LTTNNDIMFNFTTDTFKIHTANNMTNYYNNNLTNSNNVLDLTNVYSVCINKFIENVYGEYFIDDQFLLFFYNKINSIIYQRYTRMKENAPDGTIITNFDGFLFYYNIDIKEYLTFQQIGIYLSELFNMCTIITDTNILGNNTPFQLKSYVINDNLLNTLFSESNSLTSYFYELKTVTQYTFNSSQYSINSTNMILTIKIFKNIYNTDELAKYIIKYKNKNNNYIYINVTSYTISSTSIMLSLMTAIKDINTLVDINLTENIILSIPYITLQPGDNGTSITDINNITNENLPNFFDIHH
jgi:hypothetical protein